MAIIRTKRPDSFTVINNDLINDTQLDWRELGLLVYLLSKPDGWQVNAEHLSKERELGIKGIYSSLKILSSTGYVKKKPNPPPNGGWDWLVYDTPQNLDKSTECLLERMPSKANSLQGECHKERMPSKANSVKGRQVNTEYKTNTEYEVNTEITTTPVQNFENTEDCELRIEHIGGELQECFEWAKGHRFWKFVAHESISKFLSLYHNNKPDGLKAQFERRNEPQKTTTGGNNGSHQQSAKPAKVSANEQFERAKAERDKHKPPIIEGQFTKYG